MEYKSWFRSHAIVSSALAATFVCVAPLFAQGAELELRIHGPTGTPIRSCSAIVYEYHDGARQRSQPSVGQRWTPGRPRTRWTIGAATCDVYVDSSDHETFVREGVSLASLPLEGDTHILDVVLAPRRRMTGRVLDQDGVEVAAHFVVERLTGDGDWLRLAHLEPDEAAPWMAALHSWPAPMCGFDLPMPRAGWVRLTAVCPERGLARLGPLHVDDVLAWQGGVTLTIDEPFAMIAGRLLVPEGVSAADVAIYVRSTGVWWPVQADGDGVGRFEVRSLGAGTHALRLIHWPEHEGIESSDLESDDVGLEFLDFGDQSANSVSDGAANAALNTRKIGVPIRVSDAELLPPAWHVGDAALRVEVAAGGRFNVTFDARSPAPCRVHGRLTLPWPVPPRPDDHAFGTVEDRRITLEQVGFPGAASRSLLAPDGSFSLAVFEAGRYRLHLDLERQRSLTPKLVKWLDIVPGDQGWSYTVREDELPR